MNKIEGFPIIDLNMPDVYTGDVLESSDGVYWRCIGTFRDGTVKLQGASIKAWGRKYSEDMFEHAESFYHWYDQAGKESIVKMLRKLAIKHKKEYLHVFREVLCKSEQTRLYNNNKNKKQ